MRPVCFSRDVPRTKVQGRLMVSVGTKIHVQKLKPGGKLDYAWTGEVLRCDEYGIVLQAEFNVDLVERAFATFRRGDIFFEFYYWEPAQSTLKPRYYNVFQISDPDGSLKGWY